MKQGNVLDLLAAPGPFAEYANKLMLYGQFVGSWEIDSIWYESGGGRRTGKGEWHFTWVLGGRGIQDVLYANGAPPDRYSTSLRGYDFSPEFSRYPTAEAITKANL